MKIRASIFGGIALALSSAAQVQAADFASGGPYAVVTNWSGFYVGANLGFAHVGADVSASIFPFTATVSGSDTQFTGGLLAGYNWQNGNQVFGVEGDINTLSDWNYLASIRGRYGMVFDNWLYYGTAGVSFIDSGGSISAPGFGFDGFNTVGLVVGMGAETKINSRLSAGVEGLYYWFPEETQNFGPITVKTNVDVFSVRGRVTYQLDTARDFLK
jgi:outer membrane immunogenic protein